MLPKGDSATSAEVRITLRKLLLELLSSSLYRLFSPPLITAIDPVRPASCQFHPHSSTLYLLSGDKNRCGVLCAYPKLFSNLVHVFSANLVQLEPKSVQIIN